jgi:hypothetical protein
MSEITKIRFCTMISSELNQVRAMMSNEKTWALGSDSEATTRMHLDNIVDLEEYKELLLRLKERFEEGTLNV